MKESGPAGLCGGDMLRDWDARDYLRNYYGHAAVPADEAHMFRFIAGELRRIGRRFERALELGCGPVLHHAAQVIPWVERLDMADYQQSNLDEIQRWLRKDPQAFDWSVFIAGRSGVLDAEDGEGGTLAEREELMRSRIRLMRCDLRNHLPLGSPVAYPLVVSCYCAEWVDPTFEGWRLTMRKVTSLVAPGGWLLLVGVLETDCCVINGRRVPCARLTAGEIQRTAHELGLIASTLRLEVTPGLAPHVSGIFGTFMMSGQRVG
jgi:hypothetical protein